MFFEATKHLIKKQREVTLRIIIAFEAQAIIDAMIEISDTTPCLTMKS